MDNRHAGQKGICRTNEKEVTKPVLLGSTRDGWLIFQSLAENKLQKAE